ncbi:hypothetical protein F4556_001607 [Kitasatospora gansuensis]|uniref:A-factor biosynthesis hotdog domain-containing protein n=1 Tax=Kitasatospora gansuensis TaxID=258050 RepID=A0A7W7S9Q7_9ACTN|nr:AfsA-related hotdog domain-containing protein [Kitasatospora gansuensis]MBB4946072.1 hypothetical protein [Kitasatospora gansuensis]
MRGESAATAELGTGHDIRHLIHCPPSWDHYLLDAPSNGEERFVLAGEIPLRHPLFNDGSGHFHDHQLTTEAIREIGEFVGHQYFGVPAQRRGLFYRFSLELTDLAAWRAESRPARMTTDIRATPAHSVHGVPRGLDFHLSVQIDDVPCGTGSAGLVFVPPVLHRTHQEHSSWAVRATPELADEPDGPTWPVPPTSVGRAAPQNVVISEPTESTRGQLSTWVLPRADHPVLGGGGPHVSGTLLLESLRQASLLAASRAFGLAPGRSTLVATDIHVSGYAETDLPLRCAVVPGQLGRDAAGRPAVPVTLTLTQHRRAVAEARTTVVQDF